MLLEINNLIEGTIVKRPSKIIKSPYVADVIPLNQSSEILAHSASLGCCGLSDVGATILMTTMPVPKNKNNIQKCQYRIYISIFIEKNSEIIVGIHPKLAEDLTESALKTNCLSKLQNIKSLNSLDICIPSTKSLEEKVLINVDMIFKCINSFNNEFNR
jgi:DNA-binding sugar fermentation-stimulating protein